MKKFFKYKKIIARYLFILCTVIITGTNSLYAGDLSVTWAPPATNEDGSAINDLAGYKVHVGITSRNYISVTDVGNVTSHTLKNLIDGLTYYIAVTAYDKSGNESLYSDELSKTVQYSDTTPPVISGLYVSDIKRNYATINWTTSEAADSQVEFGTTLSYGHKSKRNTSLVTAHSITLTLAHGTLYHFRVYSRDSAGNLTVSADHTLTTEEMPDFTDPSITNVQVTDITAHSAIIRWSTDEPSTSQVEFGFTDYYGNSSIRDSELVTIHSVELTDLTSNSLYNFRVKSMDSTYHESISKNYSFNTSNVAPAINSFSADPESASTMQFVNFTSSSSDSDGYIVKHEWDFDGDGNYDQDTGEVANTSFIYPGAGSYNAKLRVTDNGGASTTSNNLLVTIDELVNHHPVISSVSATPSSGYAPLTVTVSVGASDPDGEISQYEWDFDGNGTIDAVTQTRQASYKFSSHGKYYVKVRAIDNNGGTAMGETAINVYKGFTKRKKWRYYRWRRW